ncbi:MAG: glycosyltransferase family 39 protein [Veillonella sp.]|nr:glycosyltransferase family 39 protein [Veillonella sp.]
MKHNYGVPLSLLLGTFLLYGFFNAYLPLTDPVETNYALTAKEMFLKDNWLSPTIYGQVWFDKPPLTYWALMLSFKLFGINDWAARFPALVTSTLSVLAMYGLASHLYSRRIGLLAALSLASCVEFWYIGHAVVTDGFLFLFSLGIFFFGYYGLVAPPHKNSPLPRPMVWAYACAGLAVLTKGPVGLVLPGIAFILYLVIRHLLSHTQGRKSKQDRIKQILARLFPWQGLVAFALIALPWYLAMYMVHGSDFITGFLGLQNVTRATISEHPRWNVWYYYIIITILATLPWTPLTIYQVIKNRWCQDPLSLYGGIWFLTVFGFYSLVATKYPTYTFVGLIPLILWTALAMNNIGQSATSKGSKISRTICIILTILYGAGLALTPLILTQGWQSTFSLGGASLCLPLFLGLSLSVLLLLAYALLRTQSYKLWGKGLAWLYLPLCMISFTLSMPPLLERANSHDIGALVKASPHPVYIYNLYATSLPYYQEVTPTLILGQTGDDLAWAQGKAVMPYIREADFIRDITRSSEPRLVIVPKQFAQRFKASPLYPYLTWQRETSGNVIFVTHP